MADFKDKFSGKQYRVSTFTDLKTAVESNAIVDGRRHDVISGSDAIKILPYRIKRGDQAKFFPGLKEGTSEGGIETGSIVRDTERGILYIPLKKKNYQNNLIGVGSHISSTFSSTAYLQVSAAFARKFSGVGEDTLITYCVEEFYTSPSASRSAFNVGEITGSQTFNVYISGSDRTTESFSAIAGYSYGDFPLVNTNSQSLSTTFTIDFDQENATHWQMSFPFNVSTNPLESNIWVEEVDLNFHAPDSPQANSASLSTFNKFFTTKQSKITRVNPSGSFFHTNDSTITIDDAMGGTGGAGRRFVNGQNPQGGEYQRHIFKWTVSGDGDSGSKYTDRGNTEIIIYPSSAFKNSHTGQLPRYHKAGLDVYFSSISRDSAENQEQGKVELTKLFFVSGAGNSAYWDGMFVTQSGLGSPVHSDVHLRHNARNGYYSVSGAATPAQTIYVSTGSSLAFGVTYAQDLVIP